MSETVAKPSRELQSTGEERIQKQATDNKAGKTTVSPRVDGCSLCQQVRCSLIQCSRPLVADSIHNNNVGYNNIKYTHISNKRHMHHLQLQKTQPE